MSCDFQDRCGGCIYRNLSWEDYQKKKIAAVTYILQNLPSADFKFSAPCFVGDGQRRRAAFAFEYKKGKLAFGFNEQKSDNLVNISSCALLTPKINANLENLKTLAAEICKIPLPVLKRGKKIGENKLGGGDILVCEADNGLDVVLEFKQELNLDYRMALFELAQQFPDIIRISHRLSENDRPETVIEKSKPYIEIAGYPVYIPAGTFLQASKASEQILIEIVLRYIGETAGCIADLFCGVGTFSYPLSKNAANKITAVDSSKSLLDGFRQSVNKNMIPNIEIVEKNLFKYPLDEKELKGFDVIVFDPPRAGASAQVQKLAALPEADRPEKIIAVSCNPHSFVKDAGVLMQAGYKLKEVTLVDQFTYSNHSELVALFTK